MNIKELRQSTKMKRCANIESRDIDRCYSVNKIKGINWS